MATSPTGSHDSGGISDGIDRRARIDLQLGVRVKISFEFRRPGRDDPPIDPENRDLLAELLAMGLRDKYIVASAGIDLVPVLQESLMAMKERRGGVIGTREVFVGYPFTIWTVSPAQIPSNSEPSNGHHKAIDVYSPLLNGSQEVKIGRRSISKVIGLIYKIAEEKKLPLSRSNVTFSYFFRSFSDFRVQPDLLLKLGEVVQLIRSDLGVNTKGLCELLKSTTSRFARNPALLLKSWLRFELSILMIAARNASLHDELLGELSGLIDQQREGNFPALDHFWAYLDAHVPDGWEVFLQLQLWGADLRKEDPLVHMKAKAERS